MKYSELFHTIQGEGKYLGVPSVFFRTSYCNLRCSWCDSPYTSWRPENKNLDVEDIVQQIAEFNCEHVVITGGEPFIQGKALIELCAALDRRTHIITIETNATVYQPVKADLISMSPKLGNSAPPSSNRFYKTHELLRIKTDVIKRFLSEYQCQVKFVVDSPADLDEIQQLQDELRIDGQDIVLMPQGIEKEELAQKQEWLVDICKRYDYRFSPRLHIDLWGNQRGV